METEDQNVIFSESEDWEERISVKLEGRIFSPDDVVQGLKSPVLATKILAARAGNLMQHHYWYSSVLVEAGIIPPLVEALGDKFCTDLQLAAACCMASVCVSHTDAVAEAGVIPVVIPLLSGDFGPALKEQAAILLWHIAGEEAHYRDAILSEGGLRAMLPHMLPDTPLELLRAIVEAYSEFCLSSESPVNLADVSPALSYIADLLSHTHDDEVLSSACMALYRLSCHSPEHAEAVLVTPELTARLVQLLLQPDYRNKRNPLLVLAKLLDGTDSQRERCLAEGCLGPIITCLSCSDEDKNKDKARQEAACAITSIVRGGSPEQMSALLTEECLRPYCALLASDHSDTLKLVLDGLMGLLQAAAKDGRTNELSLQLEEMGAAKYMQLLKHHKDNEVNEKSRHLLVTYFGEAEPVQSE